MYVMAYPWVGIQLWYDPVEYPELHMEHWRFWMNGWRVLWDGDPTYRFRLTLHLLSGVSA
ncbi:hypothetical protein PR003_g20067 [Phytophthora rubi]|uniref:Uncharacterized protein n=1 Tax=Phytophthora rubi TaxID=129364 RepID=A0A6A3JN45_9STRA|nr:hypothetical protein PR002_g19410 [Phytophthora rubi]KAE8999672.1 hypothetical protein PR001_g18987 [Phytophthora rubi]KAE9311222.1 hypothetical protein PR003_g20067 [Phytophthora rubi]